ncbi:MAG: hypothetical protein A2151_08130 [Candidatus Muproteobacteria bacterium RBG_16_65_34]|uniref:Phosphoribosyltransferase domain-containing protein n=1 Tax=Candidatus Muproteobacteria bacterium RBG_16_65_34 TaxID=1817760 RepID=A0A1F6TVU1_9PROT|nr:MAG: hypothetical protein A2151_08130 [Candidatus Muproteobacteria bacterium RBG_16_65_34]
MVNERLKQIQSWLWPGSCLLCRARLPAGEDFCAGCAQSLPRLEAACPRCAAALGAPSTEACGECQKRPPAFDRARALFTYAAPVDRLILRLKYHRQLYLARVLGEALGAFIVGLDDALPDAIVPVPLHVTRLRERGYNQSLELARSIAKRLNLPVRAELARRIRATAPQTRLPVDLRKRNVRNAFASEDAVEGLKIAIVDDVMTSGHTVNALARTLRKAGAKEVSVWVVARA